MARPHEELYVLRDCLRSISAGLDSYEPDTQQMPIIDSSAETGEGTAQTREILPGLRFLREEVRRDLQVLQKVYTSIVENHIHSNICVIQ
jgi:hypothetical protein